MDNSLYKKNTTTSKKPGGTSAILRGLITGVIFFTACILIIPLILSKTETPEAYISTAAVITVSLTAFVSAFAANSGRDGSFLFTGILTSLVIILILVSLSIVFGKSEDDKNYLFSGILYAASFIFSIFGARMSRKKRKKAKKKRR